MLRALSLLIAATALSAGATAEPADDLFDDSVLHEIHLWVHPVDWQTLKERFLENTHYPAEFTWRGMTAVDVSIRSRGLGSRSDQKPGLLVQFDRYVRAQRFLGLRYLVLDNSLQDRSFIRERLSMALFRRMGIAAPRVAHARVHINGNYAGVYPIVENIDEQFLDRHFGDPKGFLYEYHWLDTWDLRILGSSGWDYFFKLEPVTNTHDPQLDRIEELVRTVNEAPEAEFIARVSPLIDLRQLITYLATENYLAEWDGFLGTEGMNNFYLYRPSQSKQFRVIPWDKDVTFGILDHPVDFNLTTNVLARRLLSRREYFDLYLRELERAAEIAGGPDGWLAAEAERAYSQIRSAALEDVVKPWPNEDFESWSDGVKNFAAKRRSVVLEGIRRVAGK